MSYFEEISGDICYLMEIEVNGDKLYMQTKRVALFSPDIGKKFTYKRSAQRFYKDSEFDKMDCPHRVVKYSRNKNKIY